MNGWMGSVTLRPGRDDALQQHGPQGWLARLAAGRRADELPALMAGVHALCSHGHRLAAKLAVQAGCGECASPNMVEQQALTLAVARDHLLRMAHDWPCQLPCGGGQRLSLSGCPPWQPGLHDAERLAALPAWLQRHWLDTPASVLLTALSTDPVGAALRWARPARTPLADLLLRELQPALALRADCRPLNADSAGDLARSTSGPMPETGPWARAHDISAPAAHNAGMRLIARFTDLLRLASPGGTHWLLACGRPLGHGRGEALVEVGRGLLRYEVMLDMSQQPPTVQSLQVSSPTDWNVHPRGVLAEALRNVGDTHAATRLAVAFDPCVPFDIEITEAACA